MQIPINRLAACTVFVSCLLAVSVLGAAQQAQRVTMPPAAISAEEATALAQYWTAIAQKKPADVALQARQLLERFPRSPAVLATSIEAEIAGNGATTALGQYERWLGGRATEEPLVLRRIARAVLVEFARQAGDGAVRSEALVLLARDGDSAAQAVIMSNAANGQDSGIREAVRLGDAKAIDRVRTRLNSPGADKLRDLNLLGESANPLVVNAVAPYTKDPQDTVRAAAARALGQSGSPAAQQPLEPLLKDPSGIVRADAAAALYKLGSNAGFQILEQYATGEEPGGRIFAAKGMAGRPDERWMSLVRGLLSAADPSHRLDAAKLLAPHDPDAVKPVLEQLATDPNVPREEVEVVRAELVSSSMAELRALLRGQSPTVRVRASGRILAITR